MLICIADVLDGAACEAARQLLAAAPFKDGAATASWAAVEVKRNEQADPTGQAVIGLIDDVKSALRRSEIFAAAALPARFGPVLCSRYRAGATYGTHVDNAMMSTEGQVIRNDLAFTLFLSDPQSYEGGELVLETNGGEEGYKLPAGAMVLYPARHLHRVEPVLSGERLAVVGWLQSFVRNAEQREMLYELSLAKRSIFEREGNSETFRIISRTSANLLRLWVET